MICEPASVQQQEAEWAGRLLQCIQDMGRQHTNPVLQSLGEVTTIKPYAHYPSEPYCFGNAKWRAFYHCHDSPISNEREHGHFHFFTRSDDNGDWAHVVACGMDRLGQPISLYTTNLWVTDGVWFETILLIPRVVELQNSKDGPPPLNWFKYFLLLFHNKMLALLERRDRGFRHLYPRQSDNCLRDRSIYYLSYSDINLEKTLITSLNHSL